MPDVGAIDSHRHGASVVFDVTGEIDLVMADRVRAMAATVGPDDVVQVRLGQVTFMDSTGLIFLLLLRNNAWSVRLDDPPRIVRRLLEATGCTALFGYGHAEP